MENFVSGTFFVSAGFEWCIQLVLFLGLLLLLRLSSLLAARVQSTWSSAQQLRYFLRQYCAALSAFYQKCCSGRCSGVHPSATDSSSANVQNNNERCAVSAVPGDTVLRVPPLPLAPPPVPPLKAFPSLSSLRSLPNEVESSGETRKSTRTPRTAVATPGSARKRSLSARTLQALRAKQQVIMTAISTSLTEPPPPPSPPPLSLLRKVILTIKRYCIVVILIWIGWQRLDQFFFPIPSTTSTSLLAWCATRDTAQASQGLARHLWNDVWKGLGIHPCDRFSHTGYNRKKRTIVPQYRDALQRALEQHQEDEEKVVLSVTLHSLNSSVNWWSANGEKAEDSEEVLDYVLMPMKNGESNIMVKRSLDVPTPLSPTLPLLRRAAVATGLMTRDAFTEEDLAFSWSSLLSVGFLLFPLSLFSAVSSAAVVSFPFYLCTVLLSIFISSLVGWSLRSRLWGLACLLWCAPFLWQCIWVFSSTGGTTALSMSSPQWYVSSGREINTPRALRSGGMSEENSSPVRFLSRLAQGAVVQVFSLLRVPSFTMYVWDNRLYEPGWRIPAGVAFSGASDACNVGRNDSDSRHCHGSLSPPKWWETFTTTWIDGRYLTLLSPYFSTGFRAENSTTVPVFGALERRYATSFWRVCRALFFGSTTHSSPQESFNAVSSGFRGHSSSGVYQNEGGLLDSDHADPWWIWRSPLPYADVVLRRMPSSERGLSALPTTPYSPAADHFDGRFIRAPSYRYLYVAHDDVHISEESVFSLANVRTEQNSSSESSSRRTFSCVEHNFGFYPESGLSSFSQRFPKSFLSYASYSSSCVPRVGHHYFVLEGEHTYLSHMGDKGARERLLQRNAWEKLEEISPLQEQRDPVSPTGDRSDSVFSVHVASLASTSSPGFFIDGLPADHVYLMPTRVRQKGDSRSFLSWLRYAVSYSTWSRRSRISSEKQRWFAAFHDTTLHCFLSSAFSLESVVDANQTAPQGDENEEEAPLRGIRRALQESCVYFPSPLDNEDENTRAIALIGDVRFRFFTLARRNASAHVLPPRLEDSSNRDNVEEINDQFSVEYEMRTLEISLHNKNSDMSVLSCQDLQELVRHTLTLSVTTAPNRSESPSKHQSDRNRFAEELLDGLHRIIRCNDQVVLPVQQNSEMKTSFPDDGGKKSSSKGSDAFLSSSASITISRSSVFGYLSDQRRWWRRAFEMIDLFLFVYHNPRWSNGDGGSAPPWSSAFNTAERGEAEVSVDGVEGTDLRGDSTTDSTATEGDWIEWWESGWEEDRPLLDPLELPQSTRKLTVLRNRNMMHSLIAPSRQRKDYSVLGEDIQYSVYKVLLPSLRTTVHWIRDVALGIFRPCLSTGSDLFWCASYGFWDIDNERVAVSASWRTDEEGGSNNLANRETLVVEETRTTKENARDFVNVEEYGGGGELLDRMGTFTLSSSVTLPEGETGLFTGNKTTTFASCRHGNRSQRWGFQCGMYTSSFLRSFGRGVVCLCGRAMRVVTTVCPYFVPITQFFFRIITVVMNDYIWYSLSRFTRIVVWPCATWCYHFLQSVWRVLVVVEYQFMFPLYLQYTTLTGQMLYLVVQGIFLAWLLHYDYATSSRSEEKTRASAAVPTAPETVSVSAVSDTLTAGRRPVGFFFLHQRVVSSFQSAVYGRVLQPFNQLVQYQSATWKQTIQKWSEGLPIVKGVSKICHSHWNLLLPYIRTHLQWMSTLFLVRLVMLLLPSGTFLRWIPMYMYFLSAINMLYSVLLVFVFPLVSTWAAAQVWWTVVNATEECPRATASPLRIPMKERWRHVCRLSRIPSALSFSLPSKNWPLSVMRSRWSIMLILLCLRFHCCVALEFVHYISFTLCSSLVGELFQQLALATFVVVGARIFL